MIGCFVAWKCRVACLFFESSQQPTWPHARQSRRCTQVSPRARHSSQPSVLGRSVFTASRCLQRMGPLYTSQREAKRLALVGAEVAAEMDQLPEDVLAP